ncbi:MAG: hypothetical protein HOV81_14985 [Kofleriaceae bacterium]|nr:hypothetical protein [Kofleriaceae bacterium]
MKLIAVVLLASCSSGPRRAACEPKPKPVATTRCEPASVLELDQLRARAKELTGRTVTVAGPLGKMPHPWCIDCCPGLVAELTLQQDAPFVRVMLSPWSCPAGVSGEPDCALPPGGQRIVVRGRLDTVLHGREAELVLHDTNLCEAL